MSITIMISRVIRPVFAVAVLAAVVAIAGGSSVRPPLLQADGTPPVLGPCPCSDARCLPLCHNNARAPGAQAVNAEVPSAPSSSVQAPSALVAMETPPVACPCADIRCLPLCHVP
jgi:hypothetical protein